MTKAQTKRGEYPNAFAVLIGPDPEGYTEELRDIAGKIGVLEHILFLGFVSEEEKIAAYDAADVVATKYWRVYGGFLDCVV